MAHRLESPQRLATPLVRTDLDDRRRSLEQRLDDGYRRIDQASLAGSDVTEWELFWIRLLGEYEDVCRELKEAA
jgi:hypothetical protein